MTRKPAFLTFEGIDGSGKSTALSALSQWLANGADGVSVLTTKEPYDRATLKPHDPLSWVRDRARHVEDVLRPAFDTWDYILSDRYVHSCLCYQQDSVCLSELIRLNSNFPRPARTYLLDCDPHLALSRIHLRDEPEMHYEDLCRWRSRYLDLAASDPAIVVIDGGQAPCLVMQDIIDDFGGL